MHDRVERHFIGEAADGIAWATLNRPKQLNAFSDQMRDDLIAFLTNVEHDPSVRCVVLRGAGDHFMVGGDIKSFTQHMALDADARRAHFESTCHAMHPIIYLLRRMPKPVLVSVNGACAGLGFSLVLASDLAIAADNAFFTSAYTKIGTSPDGGSTYFLPRVLGMKRAMELAVLSDRIEASDAERLGVVNRVVPAAELAQETAKLAERLAKGATQAIARTKLLLNQSLASSLESQLQAEGIGFGACAATADMVEGVNAFLEKRAPDFANR
jgi:2-(1,2-epoxy-1,2-dihydrophenyl)acetyl-CoA isomerase